MNLREQLQAQVGETYRSGWLTVDQALIDGFADLTHDWMFLHVDPPKAVEAGFGGTIAHGFLVLSLLAPLRQDCGRPLVEGFRAGVNYGFERVRFVEPVRSGSRIRGAFTVGSVAERSPGQLLEEMDVTVEIERAERPAVAARWLTMYLL
jgi:acyl dehydratase